MSAAARHPVWYTIPEIPTAGFLRAVKPLYDCLEDKKKPSGGDDIFLKSILAAHSGMTQAQWEAAEAARRHQKLLEMKMGDFHEEILGLFAGYTCLPLGHATGCDVMKDDGSEVLEVKNRDNTMNSGSAESVVRKLTAMAESGRKAVLVLINCTAKKVPRFQAPASVDVVSGRDAYARLSGRATFFDDLNKTVSECFARYKTHAELSSALA